MTPRRDPRLIVVTGTPRSGTTPVGDGLAAAPGAGALYEPLNRHVGDRRVTRYFEVPGSAGFSTELIDELIEDVRTLRLRLRPGIFPDDRGLRRLAKRVTGSRTRLTYWRCRLHPRLRAIVWKDPFASFLVEHLAGRHGIPTVVTVRRPEAVAASFKRLGWRFDVADLIERLGDDGERYRHLLASGDHTVPAANAAILWHIVNDQIDLARRRIEGIHIVDLDDVVQRRQATFRRLYRQLELPWDARVDRHLLGAGSGGGPARPQTDRAHVSDRDPTAVNRYWRDVLTAAEIEFVQELDGALWERLRHRA